MLAAYPGTFICNIPLNTGIFPNSMKIAKAQPIYDKEKEHEISNIDAYYCFRSFKKS